MRSAPRLRGEVVVPGDKSLSHRALMLGAMARSPSWVRRPLMGEDCRSTLACLAALGLKYSHEVDGIRLFPAETWRSPAAPLDCGNSGTTMRLLCGLLGSRPVEATLIGDASLSQRPMGRVATPLRQMGATVEGETAPIRVVGGSLRGIHYVSPIASAQVKSAVLFAGLRAQSDTRVTEPDLSRDHTERMLHALGVPLRAEGKSVTVSPSGFDGFGFIVPGDISSAAFWMVASVIHPDAEINLNGVGLNPTRTGILDVLRQVGAEVHYEEGLPQLGEPQGTVRIARGTRLNPFVIEGALVPRLVDEIPALAVLATQCEGTSVIRDARELRVKESDRIRATVNMLRALGAPAEETGDGLLVHGPFPLRGGEVHAGLDHRIAMSAIIAAQIAEGETVVHGLESMRTSYPEFMSDLERLRRG